MTATALEHVNITVSDPDATADLLCRLFGWKVRWAGRSLNGGRTVHVGTDASYLALYTNRQVETADRSHDKVANLNHVGILVEDLESVEERVKAEGFTPFNHADYEPGRRFYFYMDDHIEVEVVSYIPLEHSNERRTRGLALA